MNLIDRPDAGFLKFIGHLPPEDNYIPVQSLNRGGWYWVDKNTPYLQIISPDPHPWGKEWVISPIVDRGIKDLTEAVTFSLSLKLFPLPPLDKATSVKIIRQIEHGKFVHTQEELYYFVTFVYQHHNSFVDDETQLSEWVTYLFYPK
ncbi:hypothetical protein G7B40_008540 [Aetokthonos hydrillicola Thurmond2011]|jgi:ligand-binding SRPBCC domain-containing protein|uniref:Uncharacterized protein n=1 Tax=Aetokthonos hydrillicola Thurmond2011 TaxID=2712845 RepID=A0AAP5I8W3_9CYAN|nr:hypothetical protein [Aetokthonos hydrillicola]MBO3463548.1 hypothetical protein [Aetokthonos hydrillicola CCALA 1050]MDR9894615.1 hypothetical protein [Aetokthonos hydrillicola Thurmond2011]